MVIVLDLDDTLILEEDYFLSGIKAIEKWLFTKSLINDEIFYQSCIKAFNIRLPALDYALKKLNLIQYKNQALEIYRAHEPEIELLPDAIWFLKQYQTKVKYALITDGRSEGQWLKIKAIQLQSYIEKIVVTGDWGVKYYKPHQRAYLEIMRHFGDDETYAFIADNPQKDFIAPNQLDWLPSIRIARPRGLHYHIKMDIQQIESFFEIPVLLNL